MTDDDLEELKRRMEQATKRRGLADDSLDPETASLRAGWLALGDLLEAAQPRNEPLLGCAPLTPRIRHGHWWLVRVATLAALVLIAVTVISFVPRARPTIAPFPRLSDVAGGSVRPGSSSPESTPVVSDNAENAEIAWDDSLDEEVELAGQAIRQAQIGQLALVSTSGQIQYELESLRKEIEGNSL
jgi:hypothetical protein